MAGTVDVRIGILSAPMDHDNRSHFPGFAELGIVASLLAILGTVSYAHFGQYQLRMRTAEAVEKLAFLFRMSAAYVTVEPIGRGLSADALLVQFPASVGPTPPLSAIGRTAIRDPPGTWSSPTWQALSFEVADPHYYAYSYDSSGTRRGAGFTARANGDLDGNHVYSTFERSGHLNAELNVEGSVNVVIHRELE